MKKLLLILSILISACATPPRGGMVSGAIKPIPSKTSVPSVMVVTADTLNVRNSPNGEISTENGKPLYLIAGDEVVVQKVETVGVTDWCQIESSRWVACRYLEQK